MSKILVTGASGFIGDNLCNLLAKRKFNFIGIDVVQNIRSKHLRSELIDCKDENALLELKNRFKPDTVIHLAARTDMLGKSLQDYEDNTLGTLNILKIFDEKKVIIASSRLVFDPHLAEPVEPYNYSPNSFYGESKVITEIYAREYGAIIVRPTSIWGPKSGAPFGSLANLIMKGLYFKARNVDAIKTMGYVSNTSNQLIKIAAHVAPELPINLGDEHISLNYFTDELSSRLRGKKCKEVPYGALAAIAATGSLLKILGVSLPLDIKRLENIYNSNCYSLNLVENICGKPLYSINESLHEYVEFLKANV